MKEVKGGEKLLVYWVNQRLEKLRGDDQYLNKQARKDKEEKK